MAATKIILEAPEFGVGRKCSKRPVNIGHLSDVSEGDYAKQLSVLKAFSNELRRYMLQLSLCEGSERAKLARNVAKIAKKAGAMDVVKTAQNIGKDPNNARYLANFTKSVISTSNFIASINRL